MRRILIDARWIEKPRGLGRYVRELLYAIGRQQLTDLEIFVLTPRGSEERVLKLGAFKIVSVRAVPVPIWEQVFVPFFAWRVRAEVVHSPCNTTSVWFARGTRRCVVTVHDLMFFDVRGATWYQCVGNAYRRFVVSRLRGPNYTLLAVSEATRESIRKRLGCTATVILEPVSNFVSCGTGGTCSSEGGRGRPYFVHVGGLAAHKNTQLVVDAFNASGLSECKLIILGVPRESRVATRWRSESVVIPGWISDREVANYIAGAIAMLFPSLMEGYGLPILEAFALGCPVITSEQAPMSEIAGGAAILVNPRSVAMVTEACRRVARDAVLRRQLVERGLRRASEFSSERIGEELVARYLDVARDV